MSAKKRVSNDELIKNEAQELLELLGVEGSVEVACEGEIYTVQIETEQAAILIGHRGETLGALQLMLRQIIFAKIQEGLQIVVNVGDWRAKREDTLTALANSAANRAKSFGQEQHLYDLSPTDRRFVHMLLGEDHDVSTESEGEGRDRHLVVKPR